MRPGGYIGSLTASTFHCYDFLYSCLNHAIPSNRHRGTNPQKVVIFKIGAPWRIIDKTSPYSMKSVLKVVHPTSFFNETFNDVEVGFLAGLKALGVLQDQVDIIS